MTLPATTIQIFATMMGLRATLSQSASLPALIWSVADLLRGDYKRFEHGRVFLIFLVAITGKIDACDNVPATQDVA